VLTHDERSLKISGGPAAKVTVRWRFGAVTSVMVDGKAVEVKKDVDGPYVEFAYTGEGLVEWQ
jgi:hypothetical protein